ncbi:MAG TPA: AIR synthase-related protein, partial [bacterium]|nr:AIR synthase-related protein [bacterium]
GVAVAIAECAIAGGIGAAVVLPGGARRDTTLFGEAPSRIVVSLAEDTAAQLFTLAAQWGVPLTVLGRTGGARLEISVADRPDRRPALDLTVAELTAAYQSLSEVFA